jgi:pimeloyl-ACP methyl ester carboxylesterase
MRTRVYGDRGPLVLVLHGGPGATGSAAELARALGARCRAVEVWQRRSEDGGGPLTVARHVADLHDHVVACDEPPALVGESWGAMLALAYAAAHPAAIRGLVLVGCGTFDEAARAEIRARLAASVTPAMHAALDRLPADDIEGRHQILGRLYDVDALVEPPDPDAPPFDAAGHHETWDDMLRLQADGTYPAAFAVIRAPVLMLHGADDPHPGAMIRDGLRAVMPQTEYRELARCGHRPWLERAARDAFLAVLGEWLT